MVRTGRLILRRRRLDFPIRIMGKRREVRLGDSGVSPSRSAGRTAVEQTAQMTRQGLPKQAQI